jgi:hypothetical protein
LHSAFVAVPMMRSYMRCALILQLIFEAEE